MTASMNETGGARSRPPDDQQSLYSQLAMMLRAFMASPVRNPVFALVGGIFAVILATAFGQILLNRWNRPFYDAVERRDLAAFFEQLVVFIEIAGGLLVLNVAQTWLNQTIKLKLREGLTKDLIDEWMRPGRAFRLANAGVIGVNPDQRLHQDSQHLTDLSAGLAIGLLQSSVLLVSFVGVLWSLSAGFAFHWFGRSFVIPGYMVWAVFIYAGTASWLSWLVGRRLIPLDGDHYAREADLRFSFVHANEHIEAISLTGGEADASRRLELDLSAVIAAVRRIIRAQISLSAVTDAYGWVATVAPILVAAPVYFAGDLSFGGLMMAVGAFNQVNASLRWFINNIGAIADWRATLLRVTAFRHALLQVDGMHGVEGRIAVVRSDGRRLEFDHVEIASSQGCIRLREGVAEIGPGERVLIAGDAQAGKTLFFRAVAGLWPWGSGTVKLPKGEEVTFVPKLPYLPRGSLSAVLAYPGPLGAFDDEAMAAALDRAGLGRLAADLSRDARWDRELGDEEQRMLALARLALHKPAWIVMDEALQNLEGDMRERALEILNAELAGSAILYVGRPQMRSAHWRRVLNLERDPAGATLKPAAIAGVSKRLAQPDAPAQPG